MQPAPEKPVLARGPAQEKPVLARNFPKRECKDARESGAQVWSCRALSKHANFLTSMPKFTLVVYKRTLSKERKVDALTRSGKTGAGC